MTNTHFCEDCNGAPRLESDRAGYYLVCGCEREQIDLPHMPSKWR